MLRKDVDSLFSSIERLYREIEEFVPQGNSELIEFRADLAGLFVVSICASYENCIKAIMIDHAAHHNQKFEKFVSNNFVKLSSNVKFSDLLKYAGYFSLGRRKLFQDSLNNHKKKIKLRTGIAIDACYEQLLAWRHAYAHEGRRNTTIREAYMFHTYGKRVIYCFREALCPLIPDPPDPPLAAP